MQKTYIQNKDGEPLMPTMRCGAVAICNPKKIERVDEIFKRVCISRGRYQMTKGVRSEKTLPGGDIFGYSVWDKVRLPDNNIGFIKGRRLRGTFVVSDIEGKSVQEIDCKRLDIIKYARGEVSIPHTTKVMCTLET